MSLPSKLIIYYGPDLPIEQVQKHARMLQKKGFNIEIIGNGKRYLTQEEITSSLLENQGRYHVKALVHGHGLVNESGQHTIQLFRGQTAPDTSVISESIIGLFKGKVDFLAYCSCFGGKAVDSCHLDEETTFITIGSPDTTMTGSDAVEYQAHIMNLFEEQTSNDEIVLSVATRFPNTISVKRGDQVCILPFTEPGVFEQSALRAFQKQRLEILGTYLGIAPQDSEILYRKNIETLQFLNLFLQQDSFFNGCIWPGKYRDSSIKERRDYEKASVQALEHFLIEDPNRKYLNDKAHSYYPVGKKRLEKTTAFHFLLEGKEMITIPLIVYGTSPPKFKKSKARHYSDSLYQIFSLVRTFDTPLTSHCLIGRPSTAEIVESIRSTEGNIISHLEDTFVNFVGKDGAEDVLTNSQSFLQHLTSPVTLKILRFIANEDWESRGQFYQLLQGKLHSINISPENSTLTMKKVKDIIDTTEIDRTPQKKKTFIIEPSASPLSEHQQANFLS